MRAPNRWVMVMLIVGVALLGSAGVLRAFVVVGPSDAPTLLWGDLVLANTAAYDLRLPFSFRSLGAWNAPVRGDMVLFRVPNKPGVIGFKRVLGIPGDVVEVRDGWVILNGSPLTYTELAGFPHADVPARNQLGPHVALEAGQGMSHRISYMPGAEPRRFGPVQVRLGEYFVLGDNRAHSNDSRVFGPVPRELILGRLVTVLRRAAP